MNTLRNTLKRMVIIDEEAKQLNTSSQHDVWEDSISKVYKAYGEDLADKVSDMIDSNRINEVNLLLAILFKG